MEMQTWRGDLWTRTGGGGEGRTNGERNMETHTLPCVKQITSGNVLHDSGNSNRGSETQVRKGVRWEEGSSGWGHMHACG